MGEYYLNPLATNPAVDYSNINTDHNWAFNNLVSGWSECVNPADGSLDTLAYASANSITITGADRTAIYTAGTKLKLTQTTNKYFIILSSVYSGGDTTINVDGREVYTIANAAISTPYFSYAYHPQGFPDWMVKSDGWINAFETWTYVSATTFTISGDVTTEYLRGDKLKLTQTTIKYFEIADISYSGGSGLTTITVNGHGVYTLANAAITNNFYSKKASPQGWFFNSGWTAFQTILTYASATSFTIVGDYSGILQKGDKIKFDQTTTKYFYVLSAVYSSPNTTITVTGGSDYSVANAAIASAYWSHVENPFGFPDLFNYDATPTGFSALPTGIVGRFSIQGNKCYVEHWETGNGTSNSTNFNIPLPVPVVTITGYVITASGIGIDNGVQLSNPIRVIFSSGATVMVLVTNWSGVLFTASGAKRAWGISAWYEI